MRITVKHLDAKVDRINRILGFENVTYNTIGAVRIEGGYGGYSVMQIANEHGGVSRLLYGYHPNKECAQFLDGMIVGLSMRGE